MHRRRFATLLLGAAAGFALAQEQPAFEVASVKVSSPNSRAEFGGGPGTSSPGQYHFNGARLIILIMDAYHVQDYQVVSKSNLDRDRFDVFAKVPAGATRDQFRTMLQNLLAERFRLKLHHETRELSGWELVVAKSGLKIKESQVGTVSSDTGRGSIGKDGFPILPEGKPGITGFYSIVDGFAVGHITAQQQPISVLVGDRFGSRDTPPIADHTGLTGIYDFRLAFSVGSPGADASDAKAPPLPDLLTAVREQLGLQFIPKKMPFDVLVIDSVEAKPVEN
jgi:uncharacterized protein (TIGR03435 family)